MHCLDKNPKWWYLAWTRGRLSNFGTVFTLGLPTRDKQIIKKENFINVSKPLRTKKLRFSYLSHGYAWTLNMWMPEFSVKWVLETHPMANYGMILIPFSFLHEVLFSHRIVTLALFKVRFWSEYCSPGSYRVYTLKPLYIHI